MTTSKSPVDSKRSRIADIGLLRAILHYIRVVISIRVLDINQYLPLVSIAHTPIIHLRVVMFGWVGWVGLTGLERQAGDRQETGRRQAGRQGKRQAETVLPKHYYYYN